MRLVRLFSELTIAASILIASAIASAQPYPTRPIRVVVAYAPGGSTDIAARLIADELMQTQGWRIVVDNRAGERIAENGVDLRMGAPAELRDLIVGEQKKYAAIVKRTGAKAE